MLREAPDLDLGRGGDTVQRTWTLAGKEGKSPLENIPRIIPLNGKRSSRPATHHVRPSVLLRTARLSHLDSTRLDSTRHAHAHGLGPARRGERARARVWHACLLIQLHKRCTNGPLFKSNRFLLKYPCGIILFSLNIK